MELEMETMRINGIEEALPLVAFVKCSFEILAPEHQVQLFLAATARDWPIRKESAEIALEHKLVESMQLVEGNKAVVKFHESVANIIAWLCGEKPYFLR